MNMATLKYRKPPQNIGTFKAEVLPEHYRAFRMVELPGAPCPVDAGTIGIHSFRWDPQSRARVGSYVGLVIIPLRTFRWVAETRGAFNNYMGGFSVPADAWDRVLVTGRADYMEVCLLDKAETYRIRIDYALLIGRPNQNAGGNWMLFPKGNFDVYGAGGELLKEGRWPSTLKKEAALADS